MPLSDTACRNAKPKGAPYKLTDGEGMFLLVQPNGSRLWRMAYRFAGKQKTLAFGVYPDVSLSGARELRAAARQQLRLGVDPGEAKKQGVQGAFGGITFEAVAREWFALWKTDKAQIHIDRVEARLNKDIFPALVTVDGEDVPVAFGSRPINKIEAPEVLQVARRIEGRGALDVARRIRGHCGQVFRYAIAAGVAKRDPSADIAGAMKPRPRTKHFVKIPMSELPQFLGKLSRYDGDEMTRLALKFTLLTWVRSTETRFARWQEFEGLDGSDPLWRIPGERMKKFREHIVPLSPQAVAVLQQVPRREGADYVFWSTQTKTGALSENTMLYALYRLGYASRATVHGFRRMASTWANEALLPGDDHARRYDADWVEMQLAHAEDDAVRGAYNAAEYLGPRRQMLKDWGALIDAEEQVGKLLG